MHRVEAFFHELPRLRLLVVGYLMLDRYLWGRATRLSPEAPVPVVEVTRESAMAGGAANVATNAAAMGAQVQLLGVIGADEAGLELQNALQRYAIAGDHLLRVPDRPTIQKTRVMASNQQLVRVDHEDLSTVPSWVEEEVLSQVERLLPNVDAVILSDYRKGLLSGSLPPLIIQLAQTAGVPVITEVERTNAHNRVGIREARAGQTNVRRRDTGTKLSQRACARDCGRLAICGNLSKER